MVPTAVPAATVGVKPRGNGGERMARDSLFGETIIWSGRPALLTVPTTYKLIAAVSGVLSLVALCFAAVVALWLRAPVSGMVAFSAWCATIALLAWRLPLMFRAGVEYLVTDKHVIWRRGRIRRVIDRNAISYALIRWNPRTKNCGDLVLVRAVPTGALRRTLSLTLAGVEAPDRLWAVVRGVRPSEPLGDGDRPLAQRLDPEERVLWTGTPLASRWSTRRVLSMVGALLVALASVRFATRSLSPVQKIMAIHAMPASGLALLVAGIALAFALLVAVAVGVAYFAWIRPKRLVRATRYLVTDRRVLIRRGDEELHLDRSRIAYVIDAKSRGLYDVFLVLDGPKARALAASGAFGESGADGALRPVFASIEDADTVSAILRPSSREPLQSAA